MVQLTELQANAFGICIEGISDVYADRGQDTRAENAHVLHGIVLDYQLIPEQFYDLALGILVHEGGITDVAHWEVNEVEELVPIVSKILDKRGL